MLAADLVSAYTLLNMSQYKFSGEVYLPGFVDLHVHLREPSPLNASETFASGTRAAALAGYVALFDMPNTPGWETWYIERLHEKHELTTAKAFIPVGAYSGSQPKSNNINQIGLMLQEGAMGSKAYMAPTTSNPNDYEPEDFAAAFREHTLYGRDKPYVVHPGLRNLERTIGIGVQDYNLRMHIAHIANLEQVEIVTAAKKSYGNDQVTAEATAHHMLMTSHDPLSYGMLARMQPPLVKQSEAEGILEALADGRVDAIATDHAPHPEQGKIEKEIINPGGWSDEHDKTCYGVTGLDFTPRLIFNLVRQGFISPDRAVDAMSTRPAQIIGIKLGKNTYSKWDMDSVERITEDQIQSGAKHSPYIGRIGTGRLMELFIGGKQIVAEGHLTGRRAGVPIIQRGQEV